MGPETVTASLTCSAKEIHLTIAPQTDDLIISHRIHYVHFSCTSGINTTVVSAFA